MRKNRRKKSTRYDNDAKHTRHANQCIFKTPL